MSTPHLPTPSDESSILRDVRWGLIGPQEAVRALMLLRRSVLECDYLAACDAVANAMAQLEHRQ